MYMPTFLKMNCRQPRRYNRGQHVGAVGDRKYFSLSLIFCKFLRGALRFLVEHCTYLRPLVAGLEVEIIK